MTLVTRLHKALKCKLLKLKLNSLSLNSLSSLSYLNFLSQSYSLNKESIVMLKIIYVECPTNTSFSMSPLSPIMWFKKYPFFSCVCRYVKPKLPNTDEPDSFQMLTNHLFKARVHGREVIILNVASKPPFWH